MCLIGMRVRPSSTVSCTGMSRIMLMSLPAVLAPVGAKFWNDAGETWSAAACSSEAVSGLASASAAAHSAAIASASSAGAALFSSADMAFPQPTRVGVGQQLIDFERVLAVRGAVMAVEHRHADHLGLDGLVQVEFDEIADLERQQLLDRGRRLRELGDQLDAGRLDLLLHQVDPALVGLGRVALDRRIQHVADRLERRVRDAEVDRAAGVA